MSQHESKVATYAQAYSILMVKVNIGGVACGVNISS